jgi:hypothetical protein
MMKKAPEGLVWREVTFDAKTLDAIYACKRLEEAARGRTITFAQAIAAMAQQYAASTASTTNPTTTNTEKPVRESESHGSQQQQHHSV